MKDLRSTKPMSLLQNPSTRTIRLLVAVGCFAFAAAAFAGVQLDRLRGPGFNGTPYPDTPPAPEFALVDHTGQPAALGDFRGSPVLLFFGFTSCPDFCPLTLDRLSKVVAADPDLADVRILLVTVDPENDTPEQLASYVARFGPGVTGLTGAEDDLQRVYADYGVFAQPTVGHDGATALAHTPVVFGIDRVGRIQVLIHPEESEEIVAGDVRALAAIEG